MASTSASFEECPICQSQVSSDKIEEHVNQCFEKRAEIIKKSPKVDHSRRTSSINSSSSQNYNIFNVNRNTKKRRIEEETYSKPDPDEKKEPKAAGKTSEELKPLAELMRPTQFIDYVGQESAIGEKSIIRNLLNNNTITSSIFWGPPGKFAFIALKPLI